MRASLGIAAHFRPEVVLILHPAPCNLADVAVEAGSGGDIHDRSVSRNLTTKQIMLCLTQGYFAHKKPPSPRTLQQVHAQGPMVVLGGGQFLLSEVPLYLLRSPDCPDI